MSDQPAYQDQHSGDESGMVVLGDWLQFNNDVRHVILETPHPAGIMDSPLILMLGQGVSATGKPDSVTIRVGARCLVPIPAAQLMVPVVWHNDFTADDLPDAFRAFRASLGKTYKQIVAEAQERARVASSKIVIPRGPLPGGKNGPVPNPNLRFPRRG